VSVSLLKVADLSFQYSTQSEPLFSQVSFQIDPTDRVGLVGPSGSGKSTLLRIIAGELKANTGIVVPNRRLRLAYVSQPSLLVAGESLWDYVMSAIPKLVEISREVSRLKSQIHGQQRPIAYIELLNNFEERGGFQFESEAENVLRGLGFGPSDPELPIASLSSPQRSRAQLAKLLLTPADLLLIDEPTMHLEKSEREWLESYLLDLNTAYVVASHDGVFLTRATGRTLDLRSGVLTIYEANYEAYLKQSALSQTRAMGAYLAP
jgi:ATP-binding cassette, subfamily F, member 3